MTEQNRIDTMIDQKALEQKLTLTGKQWAKTALLSTHALRLAGEVAGQGIVILLYHSIFEGPDSHENTLDMGHSVEIFKRQMEIVARQYDVVSMDDIPMFLTGEKRMPRRPVAVTFDDGYANNFEVAIPVLNHFSIPATFYVTTACIDRKQLPWIARIRRAFRTTEKEFWKAPDGRTLSLADRDLREVARMRACEYCAQLAGEPQERLIVAIEDALEIAPPPEESCRMLSWDQLRYMVRSGHIVGSHTVSHPNLAHVGPQELRNELDQSKRRLQEELGITVQHFAYPNPILTPHWTIQTVAAIRRAGYRTAVIATPGIVRRNDDPLCLHRVASSRKLDSFRWNLECVFLGRRAMS
jgi:peptidoglycan/xylan/chitin deacetylase (PgdA/CDA1 family)